jgi:hypothetical protein
MTSLTDEIERFRQQMLEEAREREIELVRLAAELEKTELGLAAQLRGLIQTHDQRRQLFIDELRAFASRFTGSDPNLAPVDPLPRTRDWAAVAVSWKTTDPNGEQIAN